MSAPRLATGPAKNKLRSQTVNRTFYWMVVPALLLFVVLHTIPALTGIFYSFTNYAGYGEWDFVGLQNYVNLFRDDRILSSYGFTFLFAVTTTIVVNVGALFIALLLNAKIKFQTAFRGIFFIPNVLSVLIVGYVFNYLLSNNLPLIGQALGIEWLSTSILTNPDLAWLGIVGRDRLAVHRLQRDHLPGGAADGSGGTLRGGKHRRGVALAAVHLHHVSHDFRVLHHQHGAGAQGLPAGLRPDRCPDRRRPRNQHGIRGDGHLPGRVPGRGIRLPNGQLRGVPDRHRGSVTAANADPTTQGGRFLVSTQNMTRRAVDREQKSGPEPQQGPPRKRRTSNVNVPVTVLVAVLSLTVLIPLYFTVVTALKSPDQLGGTGFELPTSIHPENFSKAWKLTNFPNALLVSGIVTASAVVLTIITNSMVAYAIARNMNRPFFKALYYFFIAALFVPFPIIMLPVTKETALLGLDNPVGLVPAVHGLRAELQHLRLHRVHQVDPPGTRGGGDHGRGQPSGPPSGRSSSRC